MVQPNLIHPMNVSIEKHNASSQVFVDGEPVHGSRTTSTIIIPAQVKWGSDKSMVAETTGIREEADGYILVRRKDLVDGGYSIGLRDKIISIGWRTGLELFIIREEPIASYPDQSGPTLIKYHFQDRTPVVGTAELE